MTEIEHLLECFTEELGEVSKETSKAKRFGLDDRLTMDPDGPRGTEGPTNREKIVGELNDLMGVVQLCVERGIIPADWQDTAAQARKVKKVVAFMRYARRVGSIDATAPLPAELPPVLVPAVPPGHQYLTEQSQGHRAQCDGKAVFENPYDEVAQPERFKAWEVGFTKAAQF